MKQTNIDKFFVNKIKSIPKENAQKFFVDLLQLLEEAQLPGYENIRITKWGQ